MWLKGLFNDCRRTGRDEGKYTHTFYKGAFGFYVFCRDCGNGDAAGFREDLRVFQFLFEQFYIHLVILFAISGVLAELILYELRNMFRTVLANDCFVEANVKSLNRMGTYSFLIALVTAGRLLLYLTPAVMIVILVFVIAGLFSKVLSQVFDRAVAYKLENDLTI